MSRVCLKIGESNLCGEPDLEDVDIESDWICEECMQLAWKEEYRRRVLLPLSKSIDRKALAAEAAEKETEPEPEPIVKRRRLVLRDYQN